MVLYKSLASMGIGAARVDTRLEKSQFQPGDSVRGEVHVRGGNIEQQIDDIYLYLVVDITKNSKKTPYVMKKYHLSKSFTIQPGELKNIKFEFTLPMELPMSSGSFPVYFKTGLDIKMGIDPSDTDKIEVFPTPLVQKLLKQFEDAGFILYRIHNEHDPEQKPHPFFQMFQFRPTGRYHGYVDELNVIFHVTDTDINMDVEMIRSARVLNSSFSWEYDNPNGTLHINNQKMSEDPIHKIQEMLNRKTLY
ncbi:sporulation protein [Paenactinomyces guangxiensis]|uniref:Sporulation protein n=1 Tax=Paenactinomyces guangxiensis TaxID=1490290 RepID=A0A7W1WSV1_9BACL|nr:sporulation protein [Paenactinomyces guangxiensis]MBA4495429.1 sporulation protein [Paenactinomyces guangxiensis]MBH8592450.1 sporulation protein [Paenactinomyces guangxiensis]